MRIWLDQVREEPFNWDEKEKVAPEELDRQRRPIGIELGSQGIFMLEAPK